MENDPGLEKQGGRWLPEGVSDVNVKKLFIDGDGVFSGAVDVRTAVSGHFRPLWTFGAY